MCHTCFCKHDTCQSTSPLWTWNASASPCRRGRADACAECSAAPGHHAQLDAQSPAPLQARAFPRTTGCPSAPHPTGRLLWDRHQSHRPWRATSKSKSEALGGFSSGNVHTCVTEKHIPGSRFVIWPRTCKSSPAPPEEEWRCAVQGPRSSSLSQMSSAGAWPSYPLHAPCHHCPLLLPITLSWGPGGGKGEARSGLWSLLKQAGVCCVEDPQWANPAVLRAERQKPPSVHHHHHYAPPAPLQAVPAPGPSGAYSMWPSMVSATTLPPATSFLPAVRHVPGPSG